MESITTLEGPALIVAVLIGIGKLLKAWPQFPDRLITTMLPLLGIAINCYYIKSIEWTVVGTGFAFGAFAVWGNQWFRQTFTGGPPSATTTSVILAIGISISSLTGCRGTLEPGGAYAPAGQKADMSFYAIDGAFSVAYAVIDGAFKFEYENRAALWKINPDIKRTLDKIRPQAVQVLFDYAKARDAYKLIPSPEGLSDLQSALKTVEKLSAAASAVVPKGK